MIAFFSYFIKDKKLRADFSTLILSYQTLPAERKAALFGDNYVVKQLDIEECCCLGNLSGENLVGFTW